MRCTNLIALAIAGAFAMAISSPAAPNGSCKPEAIRDYVKSLDKVELVLYLEELEKKKDKRCLQVIAGFDVPFAHVAATHYVALLNPDEAVAYCARLPFGSRIWMSAMSGLRSHPKKDVIGYFRQITTSNVREARYVCYEICATEKWDDLVPEAQHEVDVNDQEEVMLPNLPPGASVAKCARRYIDSIKQQKRKGG